MNVVNWFERIQQASQNNYPQKAIPHALDSAVLDEEDIVLDFSLPTEGPVVEVAHQIQLQQQIHLENQTVMQLAMDVHSESSVQQTETSYQEINYKLFRETYNKGIVSGKQTLTPDDKITECLLSPDEEKIFRGFGHPDPLLYPHAIHRITQAALDKLKKSPEHEILDSDGKLLPGFHLVLALVNDELTLGIEKALNEKGYFSGIRVLDYDEAESVADRTVCEDMNFNSPEACNALHRLGKLSKEHIEWWGKLWERQQTLHPKDGDWVRLFNMYDAFISTITTYYKKIGIDDPPELPKSFNFNDVDNLPSLLEQIKTIILNSSEPKEQLALLGDDKKPIPWHPLSAVYALKHEHYRFIHPDMKLDVLYNSEGALQTNESDRYLERLEERPYHADAVYPPGTKGLGVGDTLYRIYHSDFFVKRSSFLKNSEKWLNDFGRLSEVKAINWRYRASEKKSATLKYFQDIDCIITKKYADYSKVSLYLQTIVTFCLTRTEDKDLDKNDSSYLGYLISYLDQLDDAKIEALLKNIFDKIVNSFLQNETFHLNLAEIAQLVEFHVEYYNAFGIHDMDWPSRQAWTEGLLREGVKNAFHSKLNKAKQQRSSSFKNRLLVNTLEIPPEEHFSKQTQTNLNNINQSAIDSSLKKKLKPFILSQEMSSDRLNDILSELGKIKNLPISHYFIDVLISTRSKSVEKYISCFPNDNIEFYQKRLLENIKKDSSIIECLAPDKPLINAIILLLYDANKQAELSEIKNSLTNIEDEQIESLLGEVMMKSISIEILHEQLVKNKKNIANILLELKRKKTQFFYKSYAINLAEIKRFAHQIKVIDGEKDVSLSTNEVANRLNELDALKHYWLSQIPPIDGLDNKALIECNAEELIKILHYCKQGIASGHQDATTLRLLAIAALSHALALTTGKIPNPLQLWVALTYAKNYDDSQFEVPTGEGKSLIAALMAGLAFIEGRKVDIATTNNLLAEQGMVAFQTFYKLIGCKAAFISATSAYTVYDDSDVIYSARRELAIFRDNYRINQAKDLGSHDLILDESDTILNKNGSYRYVHHWGDEAEDSDNLELIYSLFNQIYDEFKSAHSDSSTLNVSPSNIRKKLIEKSGLDYLKIKKIIDKLTDNELKKFMLAAQNASKLIEGTHYVVETIKHKNEAYQYCKVLSSDSVPQPPDCHFSRGVQQCLHARKNLALQDKNPNKARPFLIEPEKEACSLADDKILVEEYQTRGAQITGLTATLGSFDECQHLRDHWKFKHFIVFPPNIACHRQDITLSVAGLEQYFSEFKDDDIENITKQELANARNLLFKQFTQDNKTTEASPTLSQMLVVLLEFALSNHQPILFLGKDPNKVNKIYSLISAIIKKYFSHDLTVSLAIDQETAKHTIAIAGKPNAINIGSDIMTRGVDINTQHPKGLIVVNVEFGLRRNSHQGRGRAGRFGHAGLSINLQDSTITDPMTLQKTMESTLISEQRKIRQQNQAKRHYYDWFLQNKIYGLKSLKEDRQDALKRWTQALYEMEQYDITHSSKEITVEYYQTIFIKYFPDYKVEQAQELDNAVKANPMPRGTSSKPITVDEIRKIFSSGLEQYPDIAKHLNKQSVDEIIKSLLYEAVKSNITDITPHLFLMIATSIAIRASSNEPINICLDVDNHPAESVLLCQQWGNIISTYNEKVKVTCTTTSDKTENKGLTRLKLEMIKEKKFDEKLKEINAKRQAILTEDVSLDNNRWIKRNFLYSRRLRLLDNLQDQFIANASSDEREKNFCLEINDLINIISSLNTRLNNMNEEKITINITKDNFSYKSLIELMKTLEQRIPKRAYWASDRALQHHMFIAIQKIYCLHRYIMQTKALYKTYLQSLNDNVDQFDLLDKIQIYFPNNGLYGARIDQGLLCLYNELVLPKGPITPEPRKPYRDMRYIP